MGTPFASRVLVTGSNRGLGLELVRQLTGSVDRVFATCRTPGEADALARLADRHSDTITVLPLDVAKPPSISAAAEKVQAEVDALDLLVNNAGISGGGGDDTLETVDQERLVNTFRVNAAGPHLVTRAFAPLLRSTPENATVVNVTSTWGALAHAGADGWHSYRASKAALNMLTRVQAEELQPDGVIVIAMEPGWVRTDMGGSGARITPEESVSGMLDVVAHLNMDDTNRFLDYRGREKAW